MNVFIVSGKKSRRRKRGSGAMPIYAEDVDSFMTAFKCYYTGCVPPPDPDTIPPTCTRPSNATKWSDLATWQTAETGWGGNLGNGLYGLPKQGDKVKIPKGKLILGVHFERNLLYKAMIRSVLLLNILYLG